MAVLIRSNKALIYADHIKNYLKEKTPDCILYSQDGYEFQIHKEVFCQTNLMLSILANTNSCYEKLQIFIPSLLKDDLECLVNFLYSGTIPEKDEKILQNLKEVLGYPENMAFSSNSKKNKENSFQHRNQVSITNNIRNQQNNTPDNRLKSKTNFVFKNEKKGDDSDKIHRSDKIDNKMTTKTTELAVLDEIKQDGIKDKSYVDPDAETDVEDTDGETDENEVTATTMELAVKNNKKQDSIDKSHKIDNIDTFDNVVTAKTSELADKNNTKVDTKSISDKIDNVNTEKKEFSAKTTEFAVKKQMKQDGREIDDKIDDLKTKDNEVTTKTSELAVKKNMKQDNETKSHKIENVDTEENEAVATTTELVVKNEIKQELSDNLDDNEESAMKIITSKEFDKNISKKTFSPETINTLNPTRESLKTSDLDIRKRTSYSQDEGSEPKKAAKNFICGFCGKDFSQNLILQLHVKGVHEQLKPFKCLICSETFALSESLTHHVKSAHQKPSSK